MRRAAVMLGAAGLVATAAWFNVSLPASAQQPRRAVAPKGPLNTLDDVRRAIIGCWQWPPASEIRTGMEFTVRLSFKRDGEIFGARITYQTQHISPDERNLYYRALVRAIARCSPLPVSPSLGQAIAGRAFYFRFQDSRKQRKASLDG
jgi:hypothetical protein